MYLPKLNKMTTIKLFVDRRKQFLVSLIMLFLLSILLFSSYTFGQITTPGIAPVSPPSGGFHIEGDLQANTLQLVWETGYPDRQEAEVML